MLRRRTRLAQPVEGMRQFMMPAGRGEEGGPAGSGNCRKGSSRKAKEKLREAREKHFVAKSLRVAACRCTRLGRPDSSVTKSWPPATQRGKLQTEERPPVSRRLSLARIEAERKGREGPGRRGERSLRQERIPLWSGCRPPQFPRNPRSPTAASSSPSGGVSFSTDGRVVRSGLPGTICEMFRERGRDRVTAAWRVAFA